MPWWNPLDWLRKRRLPLHASFVAANPAGPDWTPAPKPGSPYFDSPYTDFSSLDGSLTVPQLQQLAVGDCCDCDGTLVEGPRGGCALNCYCRLCGNGFNFVIHGIAGHPFVAERIRGRKLIDGRLTDIPECLDVP